MALQAGLPFLSDGVLHGPRLSTFPRRQPPVPFDPPAWLERAGLRNTRDLLLQPPDTDPSDDWGSSQGQDTQVLLARIAMLKDGTTAEHITRMAYIAECIGGQFGLTARQLDMLLHAAPLHDIGKIGIPDEILKKPGALTPDELKVMRTHAMLGFELLTLAGHASLALGAEIALCHHERWDGGGYPQGLEGGAIPLSARIVAVADVFDALTSARPYKPAWSVPAAMDHMRAQSGRHFDPDLVACLEQALPEVTQVIRTLTRPTPDR